jgi:hypothetical protein
MLLLIYIQVFPSLPEDLLKEYVDIYEEAVFSPHKFTAVEYAPSTRSITQHTKHS